MAEDLAMMVWWLLNTPVFWLLLLGHAICDYPLQGDFLSRGKNHRSPIPGVPWWQCLTAHAVIQAGAVGLVTHSPALAALEFVCHWLIDHAKCRGWFGFNVDQLLHVLCKIAWACLLIGQISFA